MARSSVRGMVLGPPDLTRSAKMGTLAGGGLSDMSHSAKGLSEAATASSSSPIEIERLPSLSMPSKRASTACAVHHASRDIKYALSSSRETFASSLASRASNMWPHICKLLEIRASLLSFPPITLGAASFCG